MDEEINITISLPTGKTDTLSISSSTSLKDFCTFSSAILGLTEDDPKTNITLRKDGQLIFNGSSSYSLSTVKSAGLKNGDLVLVEEVLITQDQNNSLVTASGSQALDFSNLLNSSNFASAPNAQTSRSSGRPSANSNLSFNLYGLQYRGGSKTPVEWDGMTLDDAVSRNPNPDLLMQVLFNEARHPHLMKELNYHSPILSKKLREAGISGAARIWREEIMKGGINRAVENSQTTTKERDMTQRLRDNPMDAEANKYFGEKIRMENVEAQYRQMIETFPESMGKVLMLYIDVEVNKKPIQAFVDSGAQSTIMSASAAEKCGILHLLDKRFEGVAVGVGTGKILGRIHIVPLSIKGGHFFPCSITVMDDNGKGLGDKNMEFLFGLDMLKRHRCKIDLLGNVLTFYLEDGKSIDAPFLHEKDLDSTKGGTKGFDGEKANLEYEKSLMEYQKKDEDDENGEL